MADPSLQIDKRCDRIEQAIVSITQRLGSEEDIQEIDRILQRNIPQATSEPEPGETES